MAFFEWVQSRLHAECDTVIAFHDGDRRAAIQAQEESAAAHHEAEQLLKEERAKSASLEAERDAERSRAEQAEAALTLVGPLTAEEALAPWEIDDVLEAAWRHVYAVRLSLLVEADRQLKAGDGPEYARQLECMAEIYQERSLRASELVGGLTPYQERLEELLALSTELVLPERVGA